MNWVFQKRNRTQPAEKALAQYAQELERSNQALCDFSFIASHDLQEPLRKVTTFGEMLLANFGEALGDEGKSYLTRMMLAAARMDSLLWFLPGQRYILDNRSGQENHPGSETQWVSFVAKIFVLS